MKDLEAEGRCLVCALPLPAKADDGICSRRCAGLRKRSEVVAERERNVWKTAIVERLRALKPGTTICPGALSRELLPTDAHPIALLRPLIFELQAERKIQLSQGGQAILWRKIRGPFRVRLK